MTESKKYAITVSARVHFVEEHSDIDNDRYVFAYTVSMINTGNIAAQLISRHWIITDATNRVQEVRGLGVVGEQPLLQPGESFGYTSGASINTPFGTMEGTYQIVAEDGTKFDAPIPAFTLAMPRVLH